MVGKDAAIAVPELRRAFSCKDVKDAKVRDDIRDGIVLVYCTIGPGAKAALPDVLPILLDDKADRFSRLPIVGFIGLLKEHGKDAWPAMKRIQNDPNDDEVLRDRIRQALESLGVKQ